VEERGPAVSTHVHAGASTRAVRPHHAAGSTRLRQLAASAMWWGLSIGLVVAAWELAAALRLINTVILPPPHEFIAEIRNQSQFLMPQIGLSRVSLHLAVVAAIWDSLRRVLLGLALGFAAAMLTGGLAFYLRIFRNLTFPTITLLAPVAPAAWIPVAILVFGFGDGAAVFVVFVGIYFTLTLATLNNMTNVSQVYINTAKVLGASRRQLMWYVIFPAILPNLFVILRMNLFAAWMGVLAAEMVGVRTGLGAVVVTGRQMMNMNLTFLGMAIIGVVGYLLDVAFGLLQRRMLWWRSGARV
jgi:NitT/TauT family transport system permease protein